MLLRHAKAAREDGVADHDRPLTGRGRRDAYAVGELLQSRELVPDVVACSTAHRTRETWDRAVAGGARAHQVHYRDEIYAAPLSVLVALVRALPETAGTVLLVGHAPGIPDLVSFLAARSPGSPAWARIDSKYPTAGLAVLTLTGGWAEAGASRARLSAFEVPRGARRTDVA